MSKAWVAELVSFHNVLGNPHWQLHPQEPQETQESSEQTIQIQAKKEMNIWVTSTAAIFLSSKLKKHNFHWTLLEQNPCALSTTAYTPLMQCITRVSTGDLSFCRFLSPWHIWRHHCTECNGGEWRETKYVKNVSVQGVEEGRIVQGVRLGCGDVLVRLLHSAAAAASPP